MRYLLDTGILLRLVHREAVEHGQVRQSVRMLKAQGHEAVITLQNLVEFWNVCTGPATARGGLGLTIARTRHRLRAIERVTMLLSDTREVCAAWKRLVFTHNVMGVQVHDA